MPDVDRYSGEHAIPDELLMERYAGGDVEAFDELFQRYERRAYVFFLRRTGSRERAQDLYQETFLRIHRARHLYDPSRPFTPWFFQVANRLLIDDHRKAFRSHEVPIHERSLEAESPKAGDRMVGQEHLDRLLHTLSPNERYVVLSSRVEGIGYPELAEHLGKSVDAVKKMASRALQRLRSLEAAAPQT